MSAPAPAALLPALAKYELLEEIGHGGMATVYRARDPRLGREVAVKVIHKHLRENAEVGARFVAEARAAAKLRHPGIVEVFDFSAEEDEERYLVVELLRGTTLRKILQRHRDMPAEVGASIVYCLCEALEHAHESGIIHRDVKPENVLVELPEDRAPKGTTPVPAPAAAARADDDADAMPASGSSSLRGQTPLTLSGAVRASTGAIDAPDAPERSSRADASPRADASAISSSRRSTPQPRASQPSQPSQPRPSQPSQSRPSQPSHPAKRTGRGIDLEVVIKLTDFGIAKVLDAQGVTSTGQVLGSPAHMAPEQIEGGEVDARTDVFALGVLMYECLVGHLPFEGKNPAQVLRRVLDGTYPAADRERPTVGGRWSRIIAAALARDASARTPTAGALGEQILAELSALGITQPRAEIQAYFQNPQGYSAELVTRLVPRLVARGEAARKAGDVPGAAADYNRALALAPSDLTILKRITSLTSSQSRKLLARRVLLLAGASTILGFSAYGVARYLKPSHNAGPLRPPPTSTATLTASPTSDVAPGPPTSKATAPNVTASAVEPLRPTPSADPSAPRPKATGQVPVGSPAEPRKVRFSLIPNGAKLILNGQPVNWFGAIFSLQPGPQSVRVQVPGSRCCEPEVGAKLVLPAQADKPDEVQIIVIKLKILPSTVTLVGAPAGGQYACPGIGLSGFGGASRQVTLPDAVWVGRCEFKPAGASGKPKTATVTLKAGEPNTIAWPGGT